MVNGDSFIVCTANKDVVNTAYLGGNTVSIPASIVSIYYDSLEDSTSVSCSRDSTFSTYLSVTSTAAGCTVTAGRFHTSYGYATVDIQADGVSTSVQYNVWFPTQLDIIPYNNVTNINRVNTPWSTSGDYVYETVRIYVYAILHTTRVSFSRGPFSDLLVHKHRNNNSNNSGIFTNGSGSANGNDGSLSPPKRVKTNGHSLKYR